MLLFEANATMLVHPEAPDGPLAHKNPSIERIFAAFQAMLAGVATGTPAPRAALTRHQGVGGWRGMWRSRVGDGGRRRAQVRQRPRPRHPPHRRAGRFDYRDPHGHLVRDEADARAHPQLAIPPAWTDVWICPKPRGHIQAMGRDAAAASSTAITTTGGRPATTHKYHRMVAFGRALPKLRARIDADLAAAACRARRCWPPWCACWRSR